MKSFSLIAVLMMSMVLGCSRHQPTPGKSPRIVSLSPHATEIIFDMGLEDHLVGISSYCVLPPGENRPVVGSVHGVNAEAILAEEPDIIFVNQRESDFDAIRQLKPSVRVIRLRNDTLAALRDSVTRLGEAVGRPDLAQALLARIDGDLNAVRLAVQDRPPLRVLWVMGTDHPTAIGGGTWMNELIELAGGLNVADAAGLTQWPSINLETAVQLDPEVLICILTGEKDRLEDARRYWQSVPGLRAAQNGRVYVTNDTTLLTAGSKIGRTARILADMIHPGAVEAGAPTTRPAETTGRGASR